MSKYTLARKHRIQHKAVIALMNEPTIREAAVAAGISESTLESWLRDPEFIELFQTAQKTALGHGLAIVELTFGKNVKGLQNIADDPTVNASVRATAYAKLIDIGIGLSKQRSNARYVEQLEEELRQLRSGQVEEITGEEISEARSSQRQRQLPSAGGTVRIDADGGPIIDGDTEGEEATEGDD